MSEIQYIETKIYTTSAGAEPVLALLLYNGIDQVAVQDSADYASIVAAKETLGWDYIDESLADESETIVTFYTEDGAGNDALLSKIKIDLMKLKSDEQYGVFGPDADFGRLYAASAPLEDDWKDKWKESFKPFRATERIAVRPSWDVTEDELKVTDGADVVVTIDPGMAFGTGSHETTSMCLAAVEDAMEHMDGQIALLDLGTGTGILSIAGVGLGAATVVAAEYDEDSLSAARRNIALNDVPDQILLIGGDVTDDAVIDEIRRANGDAAYDVIVANIHKNLLIGILPAIASLLRHGGRLILSGLIHEDEAAITQAVRASGFTISSIMERGEWLAICVDFL